MKREHSPAARKLQTPEAVPEGCRLFDRGLFNVGSTHRFNRLDFVLSPQRFVYVLSMLSSEDEKGGDGGVAAAVDAPIERETNDRHPSPISVNQLLREDNELLSDDERNTTLLQYIENNRGMKRNLRGLSVSRITHIGAHPSPPNQPAPLNNNTILSPPITSSSTIDDTSSSTPPAIQQDSDPSGTHGLLLSILCFLIVLPCILASIAQSIYCFKKRRRDRVERQLMEVSTNPTSRMLVLSEIFKNDSRVS